MSDLIDLSAEEVISRLRLAPHPEGGHYRETWRSASQDGVRAAGSAIYYLLARGERSHWHRIDASEAWHHYAGAPLRLGIAAAESDSDDVQVVRLGTALSKGEEPQAVVPPNYWQVCNLDELILISVSDIF